MDTFLHRNEPTTEAEIFARIPLQPGEHTLICGALDSGNAFLVASRAEKIVEDELELFCLDTHGNAQTLTARKGSAKIFAASLSLAWPGLA
jgi:hypothetical protein